MSDRDSRNWPIRDESTLEAAGRATSRPVEGFRVPSGPSASEHPAAVDSCGNSSCIEHGVDRIGRYPSNDPDGNEWWLLRCLEEAVRDIDRLTGMMSTDFDAISTAYQRKRTALTRLEELRNA